MSRTSSKVKTAAFRPCGQGLGDELHRDGRLADPGGPEQERRRARPGGRPRVIRSRFATPLENSSGVEPLVVLRRDQPRVDDDAPSGDLVVVVAVAEVGPADLGHVQPPAGPRRSPGRYFSMTMLPPTRLSGWIWPMRVGAVVEQQDRRLLLLEVVLEGEELAAIAERVGGQEPQLREAVEDDVPRPRCARPRRGSAGSSPRARPPRGGRRRTGTRRRR